MTIDAICRGLDDIDKSVAACFGCGCEHNCTDNQCAIIRAAKYTLRGQQTEIRRLYAEIRALKGGRNGNDAGGDRPPLQGGGKPEG